MNYSPPLFRFSASSWAGFSLIEILIVLGIMTVLLPLGLTSGSTLYERSLARNDRTMLVAAIREARAQALSGSCTAVTCATDSKSGLSPHGVYVSGNGITLFAGSSYAARFSSADVLIPFSATEDVSGSREVVFAALSADISSTNSAVAANSPVSIVLTGDDNHTETVVVSSEGSISSSTT